MKKTDSHLSKAISMSKSSHFGKTHSDYHVSTTLNHVNINNINNNSDNKLYISDSQIGASTQQEPIYIANECRLNNPFSCWMPSDTDQNTLDTWIRVDLGEERAIAKIG